MTPDTKLREMIARIIDPAAWDAPQEFEEYPAANKRRADRQASSLTKADAILALPALRGEEIRGTALEEAANIAEELYREAENARTEDRRDMGRDYDPNCYGSGHQAGEISAATIIAEGIRALTAAPAPEGV